MYKIIFKRKASTIFALFFLLAACTAIGVIQIGRAAIGVSSGNRLLPIYCVDTQGKKQVAISFDAAWGAGR